MHIRYAHCIACQRKKRVFPYPFADSIRRLTNVIRNVKACSTTLPTISPHICHMCLLVMTQIQYSDDMFNNNNHRGADSFGSRISGPCGSGCQQRPIPGKEAALSRHDSHRGVVMNKMTSRTDHNFKMLCRVNHHDRSSRMSRTKLSAALEDDCTRVCIAQERQKTNAHGYHTKSKICDNSCRHNFRVSFWRSIRSSRFFERAAKISSNEDHIMNHGTCGKRKYDPTKSESRRRLSSTSSTRESSDSDCLSACPFEQVSRRLKSACSPMTACRKR